MTFPLSCEKLKVSYGSQAVIDELDLALPRGEVTAIVGPNGCGKSTLLRCLSRLQKPDGGTVFLDGEPIQNMSTRAVAKRMAVLPQKTISPAGMRVIDLVMRGRTPHQSPLRQWSQDDRAHVAQAMSLVGLTARADQSLESLSGGQLQRAWIAMVLAQDTEILLLDEPTTYLDLAHQRDILELVRMLQAERALTVAMVLHDINLAARYADRIVALRERKLIANGSPENVVTAPNIAAIYGLDSTVIQDPHCGRPHVIVN